MSFAAPKKSRFSEASLAAFQLLITPLMARAPRVRPSSLSYVFASFVIVWAPKLLSRPICGQEGARSRERSGPPNPPHALRELHALWQPLNTTGADRDVKESIRTERRSRNSTK